MKRLWQLYYRIHALFAKWWDRIHCNIQISFKRFPFEIQINERYKPLVIWGGRFISLLSFITIWLIGLPIHVVIIVGLILWTSSEVVSHFVFHYSAFFLQPMPLSSDDVKFENLAYAIAPDRSIPTMVGLVFKDERTAKASFDYFRALTSELDEDIDDKNIKIRAVLENGTYYFYLYPSVKRAPFQEFRERQEELAGDRPIMTFTMYCIICKGLVKAAGITRFMSLYRSGEPYYLTPFINTDSGPEPLMSIKPILKHEFIIIKSDEISKRDDPLLYNHYTRLVRTKK